MGFEFALVSTTIIAAWSGQDIQEGFGCWLISGMMLRQLMWAHMVSCCVFEKLDMCFRSRICICAFESGQPALHYLSSVSTVCVAQVLWGKTTYRDTATVLAGASSNTNLSARRTLQFGL